MKKTIILIMLSPIIIACIIIILLYKPSKEIVDNNSKQSLPPQSIPSQIGQPNDKDWVNDQKWSREEILTKTGYQPFTGKGFANILIAQPPVIAFNEPGQEEGYYVESIPDGKKVRIQLIERKFTLAKIKLIEEKVYTNGKGLTVHLPNKENVLYSISVEMLDDQNTVIDTLVNLIFVPPNDLNALLSIDKTVYSKKDILELELTNWGSTTILHGEGYYFHKFESGRWNFMNLDLAFPDIGYQLNPKESFLKKIDLAKLKPGKYRIVKEVWHGSIVNKVILAVEFEIQ